MKHSDYSISPNLLMRVPVAVSREPAVQQRTEDVAGVGAAGTGDFFGSARGDDAAAVFAAFWSKIDDIVR